MADVLAGARRLRRSPATAMLATIAVAFGIAAPTAMYSIVRGMLRDLPVHEGERVLYLTHADPRTGDRDLGVSHAELRTWRDGLQAVDELSAFQTTPVSIAGAGGFAERRSAARVEARVFSLLRLRPGIGEIFTTAEEDVGAPRVALISDDLWRVRFGADPSVIGLVIRVDGNATRIVGVMPPGFRFPFKEDLWLPLAPDERPGADTVRSLRVVGRLAAGVTLTRARAELAAVARRAAVESPSQDLVVPVVMPYKENQIEPADRLLFRAMVGVVMLLLLVACMNVASLLTVRVTSRAHAVAIRRALGASRLQVVRETLGEVAAIAIAGGALGVFIAWRTVEIFYDRLRDDIPNFWMVMRVDWAALSLAALLVTVAILAAGLGPALHAARVDPGAILRDAVRGGTSRRSSRLTRSIVVVEIAGSCVLLIVAGLMIAGVRQHTSGRLAISTDGVLTARLAVRSANGSSSDTRATGEAVLAGLEALPSVTSVALASALPGLGGARARMSSDPLQDPSEGRAMEVVVASPGLFALAGADVIAGRGFRRTDDATGPVVAVLTRSAAANHFPRGGAIGADVRVAGFGAPVHATVVGIVEDFGTLSSDPVKSEVVFLPFAQRPEDRVVLLVRPAGDATRFAPRLREQVAAVDPDLPLQQLALLSQELQNVRRPARLFAALFASFGAAGLLLACLGLYGTVAFGLGLRRREFGIRSALGARPTRLTAFALRGGLVQATVGTALGVALAVLLAPSLENLFFGASAHDPLIYGAVVAAFLLTALCATLRPALRAARTDPALAMRAE